MLCNLSMDIKHVEKDSFIHTMQILDGGSVIDILVDKRDVCLNTYVMLVQYIDWFIHGYKSLFWLHIVILSSKKLLQTSHYLH